MIDYDLFYEILLYGSENWKGNFTSRELDCFANDYLEDFEVSKNRNKPTQSMKSLMEWLKKDGSEQCKQWLDILSSELKGKE